MVSRMIRTCSAPVRPCPDAAAVLANTGSSGSPVKLVRGPSCSASRSRRVASALEIINRWVRLGGQPGDDPVRLGGQLTVQGFQSVEHGEQLGVGQCVHRQRGGRGKHRTGTHISNTSSIYRQPRPRFVTTETTVTQEFWRLREGAQIRENGRRVACKRARSRMVGAMGGMVGDPPPNLA
jgi:hypothetical protein